MPGEKDCLLPGQYFIMYDRDKDPRRAFAVPPSWFLLSVHVINSFRYSWWTQSCEESSITALNQLQTCHTEIGFKITVVIPKQSIPTSRGVHIGVWGVWKHWIFVIFNRHIYLAVSACKTHLKLTWARHKGDFTTRIPLDTDILTHALERQPYQKMIIHSWYVYDMNVHPENFGIWYPFRRQLVSPSRLTFCILLHTRQAIECRNLLFITHRICRTWFRHTFCENLLERTWAQI